MCVYMYIDQLKMCIFHFLFGEMELLVNNICQVPYVIHMMMRIEISSVHFWMLILLSYTCWIDASVDISLWFSLTPVMWYVDISIFWYQKWQLLYIINVRCLYVDFLFFFFCGWMELLWMYVCSYLKEMLQKCLLINTRLPQLIFKDHHFLFSSGLLWRKSTFIVIVV